MIDFLRVTAALLLMLFGWRAFFVAFRLWRGNSHAYSENRIRTGRFSDALFGRLATDFDGRRDYHVSAGIAIDRKSRQWVDQGRLSLEAIDATLRD